MPAHSENRANHHIEQGFEANKVDPYNVKGNLDHSVDEFPVGRRFGYAEQRSQRVKCSLQEKPDDLADAMAEEPSLEMMGQVRVHVVIAKKFVVIEVVLLERNTCRNAGWQICPNADEAIEPRFRLACSQVMRYFVERQNKRMVDSTTETVGHNKY